VPLVQRTDSGVEMKVDQLGLIEAPSPLEASTPPRVLFAGAGAPSGVAAIRALDGEALDIFSADFDPRGYGDSYTELLFELCEEHRIDVLIPAMDCELLLLASARALFAGIDTGIVLPSEETLRLCLDRRSLRSCCRGVVRVSDSGLADEDVPGAEYSLATLAGSDGEVIAVVPWAQADSGTAESERIVRDERLEELGRQVASQIGLTSLANIQVKEPSDGEPVLLEVNPCFTGAMPPPGPSGVSMLRLCVESVLADG